MVFLVKVGNDILHNCPKCYRVGLSTRLEEDESGDLVCTYKREHRYKIENGQLKEL